ncbi:MAG: GNAT family N-acetyltransferase [Phycisphaerales bacterium]
MSSNAKDALRYENSPAVSGDTCESGPTMPALDGPLEIIGPWEIRTARYLIRPLRETDRAEYVEMLAESRASLDEYLPLHRGPETDHEVFDRQMSLARASATCPDVAVRRVIEGEGRLIGAININDIQQGKQRSAEIAVWITRSAAGHGAAGEVVSAVAEHALASAPRGLGLDVVYALVSPGNAAAIRVFERAGFMEVPNVPLVELVVGGAWRPHSLFIREASPIVTTPPEPMGRAAAKIVVRRLMASASRA